MDEIEITEVTGLDVNPTDRVFAAGGRHVKVRVLDESEARGAPFGVAILAVSGSETDAAGAALARGDGYRVAPEAIHTIQADAPVDLASLIADLRGRCVLDTLRRADVEDGLAAAING